MLAAMRTSISLAFSLVLAVAATACGGKKSAAGGGAASCNTPKLFECNQYSKDNRAIGDEPLKRICDGAEGTFGEGACPAADRLGVCSKPEGTKVFYKGHPMTAAELGQMCADGQGTWKAP